MWRATSAEYVARILPSAPSFAFVQHDAIRRATKRSRFRTLNRSRQQQVECGYTNLTVAPDINISHSFPTFPRHDQQRIITMCTLPRVVPNNRLLVLKQPAPKKVSHALENRIDSL